MNVTPKNPLEVKKNWPYASVCPQPAPIYRSYEVVSCEWALNMVPVYVCRTGMGDLGYQPRPQTMMYPPYNQPPVYPSFPQPQTRSIYTTFTTRQPAQYRQFTAAREEDVQPLSQNGQSIAGGQQGFTSRAVPRSGYQAAMRDASPTNGQSQPLTNQSVGTHTQRQLVPPIYQQASLSAPSEGLSQSAQPSYPQSQPVAGEGPEPQAAY